MSANKVEKQRSRFSGNISIFCIYFNLNSNKKYLGKYFRLKNKPRDSMKLLYIMHIDQRIHTLSRAFIVVSKANFVTEKCRHAL